MYAEMSTSAKSIKKNLWWPHTKQPSLLWLCNYCNCQQYAQYNSIHFFFTKLQDQKNESCFDDIKKKVWRNGPLQFWCFEYLNGISIQTLNKNSFRDIFANILLEQLYKALSIILPLNHCKIQSEAKIDRFIRTKCKQ